MGNFVKRFTVFFIFLVITVQGALLCCDFVAFAAGSDDEPLLTGQVDPEVLRPANMTPSHELSRLFRVSDRRFDDDTIGEYAGWLSTNLSAQTYTREAWLTELIELMGFDESNSGTYAFSDQYLYPCCDLFVSAFEHGMVYSTIQMEPYAPLTRSYLAKTLMGALGYAPHTARCADLSGVDTDMMTMVYFGYFTPDDDGCVYPEQEVSYYEAQGVLDEVSRYIALRGKHILSFGDSIMYGMGNKGIGVADMVGEKYGMSVTDYSVSGAAFEAIEDHGLILDQITEAVKKGETADIILIDGGTNDVTKGVPGTVMRGKSYKTADRKTFAGSVEYAMGLLSEKFAGTPVVFVRAHNMISVSDESERSFGEMALEIADKWGAATVDVYSDTDLNTEIEEQSERYTLYRADLGHHDSVHPNRECYTEFYLPLVSDAVFGLLK